MSCERGVDTASLAERGHQVMGGITGGWNGENRSWRLEEFLRPGTLYQELSLSMHDLRPYPGMRSGMYPLWHGALRRDLANKLQIITMGITTKSFGEEAQN